MYLGLGLLYVGAVLVLNGIWLLGYIQNREIWVINLFSGGLVLAIAFYSAFGPGPDQFSVFAAAQFLLFAFTYLWVGINQFLDVDSRGLGWYCLFVAITAVPIAFTSDSAFFSRLPDVLKVGSSNTRSAASRAQFSSVSRWTGLVAPLALVVGHPVSN